MSMTSSVDFLIIGGGIAGTTAAETIRQRSEGRIMIVTDEKHVLYSRVRLPDYVAGKISREKVFIKEERWYHEKKIKLKRETSVKSLSPKERRAYLNDGGIVQYQRLLLATGGLARKLNIEGSGLSGVHYLRTIEDAEGIMTAVPASRNAVVVGGGFIGLELTRCFIQKGLETVMVLMEPQFWPAALDEESSKMIENTFRDHGAVIRYSDQLTELKGNGKVQTAVLKSGQNYGCDILGVGVGIETRQPFVVSSGLAVQKGVLTNEYLQTSDPDVFAAGDISEFYDVSRGQRNQIGNWSNAVEQGKAAGLNMLGEKNPYRFISNYVIRLFGLNIGFVGNTAFPPGTDVIRRGSADDGGYIRLFVRDGVIKGATLMNRLHEMKAILKLIADAVNVDRFGSRLSDTSFDLDHLLP